MATYTQTRLVGPEFLTGSDDDIYTVGSGEITIVKQIMVCNIDVVSSHTFTLYLLKNGDTTPADADTIFKAVSLDPGETRLINLSQVMTFDTGGDAIWGKASTGSKITITISGIVETA